MVGIFLIGDLNDGQLFVNKITFTKWLILEL